MKWQVLRRMGLAISVRFLPSLEVMFRFERSMNEGAKMNYGKTTLIFTLLLGISSCSGRPQVTFVEVVREYQELGLCSDDYIDALSSGLADVGLAMPRAAVYDRLERLSTEIIGQDRESLESCSARVVGFSRIAPDVEVPFSYDLLILGGEVCVNYNDDFLIPEDRRFEQQVPSRNDGANRNLSAQFVFDWVCFDVD